MNSYRPQRLMAPPPTLRAELEVAKAIRTLAVQEEADKCARRLAEISAIRRDLEEIPELQRQALGDCRALPRAELRKYSPGQPRVPAGNPDGGEWTSGNVDAANSSRNIDALASGAPSDGWSDDARVISDAAPWIPGARYAGNEIYLGNSPKNPKVRGSEPYLESNTLAGVANIPSLIPVADFSGGAHGALVDAFMALFRKQGFPAAKEVPISLVGSAGVFGRLDILAKLPICIAVCAFEMKTGIDPTFTENQRVYIPLLPLGGHVYSTDPRIGELGLLPGLPFPPMHVFIVWSVPLEPGYRVWEMPPKKPALP
jgi:hypothetical protein